MATPAISFAQSDLHSRIEITIRDYKFLTSIYISTDKIKTRDMSVQNELMSKIIVKSYISIIC